MSISAIQQEVEAAVMIWIQKIRMINLRRSLSVLLLAAALPSLCFAEAVFEEHWDSNTIDSTKWTTHDGSGVNMVTLEEVSPGDYAIFTKAGLTSNETWQNWFYSGKVYNSNYNDSHSHQKRAALIT